MSNYCSILFTLFLWVVGLSGYAQFSDDFSDGNFSSNPQWSGDVSLFTVAEYPLEPGNEMLRSNSPAEADYYLSTASSIVSETTWTFFFNLQFGTSGVNYFDAFLVADDMNLGNVQNGYFLRFGSTDDDITFWKRIAGTDVLLIDGPDGQIGSSSNNPFRIQVALSDAGLWAISVDDGATGVYSDFGTVTDNDVQTTQAFGFRVVQSSAASAVNSHWFDDIEVAEILPDVTPPNPLSVETLSLTELSVEFDEPLDQPSAENVNNYEVIPGAVTPQNANANGAVVTLVLAEELMNGNAYTLSVSGVSDVNDNTMDPAELEFTVIIPETAEFKDVVINEIMADPTPVVGNLPQLEYLEIYNASNKYIALENWELVNTSTVRNLPEWLLEPGQHAILCDLDVVDDFDEFGVVVGIASFTALTNGGDSLTLNDNNGTLIDVVEYTDNWYGDPEKAEGGWSLELINPETPCSGPQNWIASNNTSGGTPGAQNSVFDTTPDTAPPTLEGFSIEDPLTLTLFFSETLDPASLAGSTIGITPSLGIAEANMGGELTSITIELVNPIDTAVFYTVSVSGITDCPGNPIAPDATIDFVIGYTPGLHDILINELMADPTPEVGWPDQEYIELYNRTDQLFDLSNCSLSGEFFAENTFIGPSQHLLLVPTSASGYDDADSVTVMPDLSASFLTNGGRELVLLNGSGETVDRVNYSSDWYRDPEKNEGGWSLERINPNEPCRGGDNWRASEDPSGGTPGFANSVLELSPDTRPPELLTIIYVDSTTIELVFDEVLDSVSVIAAGYSFQPELTVFDVQNNPPDYHRVRLQFPEALTPNIRHEITVFGLSDCTGNAYANADDVAFGRPGTPTTGNLILNEVLFNERAGSEDYVEVYNNSNAILSLEGWQLGNLDNEQFNAIAFEGEILFPGEYMAITTDKQSVGLEYPFAPPGQLLQVDDMPTLNNGEGRVVLIHPQEQTVDRFDYSEDYHFALLNDVDGVSLERIDFNRPSDDPTNWTSAAESFNWGTPGFENSQLQEAEIASDDVSVSPEVFSPDNDGFQDVLNINYQFDRSGMAGNVTIFDASGRLVRQLARNELLGASGTLSWDGTSDDGERARVGIHVVYFEVFATDGHTAAYKLSCVVASRL